MGSGVANVGDPNLAGRHWRRSGAALVAFEERLHFHHGNAGINTTSGLLDQADIASLHTAAMAGEQALVGEMALKLGSWWTTLLANADTAIAQQVMDPQDDPRRIYHRYYLGPIVL